MKQVLLETQAAGEPSAETPRFLTKLPTTIHYVGDSPEMEENLQGQFKSVVSSKNLLQASQSLQSTADDTTVPDVVMIDVPFSVKELNHIFKHIVSEFPSVIVVCNRHCVDERDLADIKGSRLVDDVFDLYDRRLPLSRKIQFLQRVKEQYHNADQDIKCREMGFGETFTRLFKRTFDLVVATFLLILMLPVFLVILLAIWLESGGPIIYSSLRVGQGYSIFRFYKFRTMVKNADQMIGDVSHLNQYKTECGGPTFLKIADDPRITRLGKFLRNSSLDELPQLFNVIKGDMSIVGNRPLPLYEAETLTTNEFMERFCAPAGITGLWQIKKRGQSEMSVGERVSLDIAYARNVSTRTDFEILMATPRALFQKSNV